MLLVALIPLVIAAPNFPTTQVPYGTKDVTTSPPVTECHRPAQIRNGSNHSG